MFCQRVCLILLSAMMLFASTVSAQNRLKAEPAVETSILPPFWQGGMPSTGTVRIPVFLVDFPDYPHNPDLTPQRIYDKYFGNGIPETSEHPISYVSISRYFTNSSYGKLNIQGDVYGWYTSSRNRSSIDYDRKEDRALLQEVLNYHAGQGVDFSQYDSDGDGFLDALYVNWTGPDSGFPWQQYSPIWGESRITAGGKIVNKLSWSWVSSWSDSDNRNSGSLSLNPDVHETGHLLGLPDLYHYSYGMGPSGGVGMIDLMDGGYGADINCFFKFLLGWITPSIVSQGHSSYLKFRPAGNSPDAAIVMPAADLNNPFSEFFMVEYRKKNTGNDTSWHLGDGLAVWHVDGTLSDDGQTFKYNNTDTPHKLVRLMEADGLEHIENGGFADPGDFFGSSDRFGPYTSPPSTAYSGESTDVTVDSIMEAADSLIARLSVGAWLNTLSASISSRKTSARRPLKVRCRAFSETLGTPLAGQKVSLYTSSTQRSWKLAARTRTSRDGSCRLVFTPRTRGTLYLQLRIPGRGSSSPAWTNIMQINVDSSKTY